MASFQHFVNQYQHDVYVISETWLHPRHVFSLPGYSFFRLDHPSGYKGLCVCYKSLIPMQLLYQNIDPHTDLHCIICRADSTSLVAVYNPHGTAIPPETLRRITDVTGPRTIIGGDFNIQANSWNTTNGHPAGRTLHNTLTDSHFTCVNTDDPTRVGHATQRDTIPDLIFLSTPFLTTYTFSVFSDTQGSDHYPRLLIPHEQGCAITRKKRFST